MHCNGVKCSKTVLNSINGVNKVITRLNLEHSAQFSHSFRRMNAGSRTVQDDSLILWVIFSHVLAKKECNFALFICFMT